METPKNTSSNASMSSKKERHKLSDCYNKKDLDTYAISQTLDYSKPQKLLKEKDEKKLKLVLGELFECSVYVEKIEKDVIDAFGDYSISIGDIPKIVSIAINSFKMIRTVVKTTNELESNVVKYIIFGIIYRIIINDYEISDTERSVLNNYETLWDIISFPPFEAIAKCTCKICAKCCCV